MAAKKAKSGKRSRGRRAEQPRKFTSYLDAGVGCAEVVDAFDVAKIKYKLHVSFFNPYTHDDTWLPKVGKNNWVLLTTDDRMAHRGAEAQAIKTYGVRSFVFKSHMRGPDMAKFLLKMMPAMRRFCGKHEKPFIAFLQPNRKIKIVMDKNGIVGPLKGRI